MNVIVEFPRPYTEDVFEHLPGENVLVLNGHSYWCADARTRRLLSALSAVDFDDFLWVCGVLNDAVITDALDIPHRRNRLELHQLQDMLTRLTSQQDRMDANPVLLDLMDDPNELRKRIDVVRVRLRTLRGI
jgi:hypothetical protein